MNHDQWHGGADETLRERSIREANEQTERGKVDKPNQTTSWADSDHPSVRAERARAEPDAGKKNDRVAYQHLVDLRKELGLPPMSSERAGEILEP